MKQAVQISACGDVMVRLIVPQSKLSFKKLFGDVSCLAHILVVLASQARNTNATQLPQKDPPSRIKKHLCILSITCISMFVQKHAGLSEELSSSSSTETY